MLLLHAQIVGVDDAQGVFDRDAADDALLDVAHAILATPQVVAREHDHVVAVGHAHLRKPLRISNESNEIGHPTPRNSTKQYSLSQSNILLGSQVNS
jgi:hypothetical protein